MFVALSTRQQRHHRDQRSSITRRPKQKGHKKAPKASMRLTQQQCAQAAYSSEQQGLLNPHQDRPPLPAVPSVALTSVPGSMDCNPGLEASRHTMLMGRTNACRTSCTETSRSAWRFEGFTRQKLISPYSGRLVSTCTRSATALASMLSQLLDASGSTFTFRTRSASTAAPKWAISAYAAKQCNYMNTDTYLRINAMPACILQLRYGCSYHGDHQTVRICKAQKMIVQGY
jgi:hypothetical protein